MCDAGLERVRYWFTICEAITITNMRDHDKEIVEKNSRTPTE